MTYGTNAGIRRNRRKQGEIAVERRAYFSSEISAALDTARHESGDLSLGLYLERVLHQLVSDQGTLPVIAPPTNGTEVRHTNAA